MRKKLIGSAAGILSLLSISSPVLADSSISACPPGAFGNLCNQNANSFGTTVGSLVNLGFVIATLIALAYLVYGGVKWITSGGEKTDVEGARNHITAAIIGLVIVFLSYFILNFILTFFTGNGISNISIPVLPKP